MLARQPLITSPTGHTPNPTAVKLTGTDPTSLLHRALMAPAALETLPTWLMLLILASLAAGAGWLWRSPWLAAGWFAFALLDWALLVGLPRTGRSFGPVRPPLLALELARLALTGLLAWPGIAWLLWCAMGGLSLLAWYGTWLEPMRLGVTERTLALSHWPADAKPLRLLHLSDLHLERTGRREQALERLTAQLAPDLICFTGDLLNLSYNRDPQAIAQARELIGRWQAPLGVYAVSGSPLVDLPETAAAVLDGLPNLRWLRGEAVTAQHDGRPLALVGLSCSHNPAVDGPSMAAALQAVRPDVPAVLLYHSPDLAPQAAEAGVSLQLSGHTHGGQIRLPLYGAVVTSSIYRKRFEMGAYDLPRDGREPMALYVSRGIGMEGGAAPRARLLCPPEIVLWTLTGRQLSR